MMKTEINQEGQKTLEKEVVKVLMLSFMTRILIFWNHLLMKMKQLRKIWMGIFRLNFRLVRIMMELIILNCCIGILVLINLMLNWLKFRGMMNGLMLLRLALSLILTRIPLKQLLGNWYKGTRIFSYILGDKMIKLKASTYF